LSRAGQDLDEESNRHFSTQDVYVSGACYLIKKGFNELTALHNHSSCPHISLLLISLYSFITAGFVFVPANAFCLPTGAEIMERVYNRDDGDDSKAVYDMVLEDKGGDRRVRKMIVYTKDYGKLVKSVTRFTSPADIAGTGFLNWDNSKGEDDQFLYLPALKRVRRVVSTQKHLRFVNTDFTNEDMERREVERDEHHLIGAGEYNTLKCYVIKSKKHTRSQYGYFKSWIAEDLDLAVKVEFYDKKLRHIKTFEAQALKKIDNIWTISQSIMVDHRRKHKTMMTLKNITYNGGLPDNYFTKNFLRSH
jgi:hypothetical protein